MVPHERQAAILQILKSKNFVKTLRLCDELYVSPATIRRDLAEMERQGLLRRISGGAKLIEDPKDLPFSFTAAEHTDKKMHIAKLAVQYIRDGQRIFMDSSTTVFQVIAQLRGFENLTVLTHGILTAAELCKCENVEVYMLGGKINRSLMNVRGIDTKSQIESHYSDLAFISCRGINARGGFDANDEEAAIKLAFAKNTDKLILLVDSSKFNKSHFNISSRFDDISVIISDKPLPSEVQDICDAKGIRTLY